jgi:hypothetical protein
MTRVKGGVRTRAYEVWMQSLHQKEAGDLVGVMDNER